MKKAFLSLSLLLVAEPSNVHAKNVWLLNLTNSPQSYRFLTSPIIHSSAMRWFPNTIDAPARSKSDGYPIGKSETCFKIFGLKCLQMINNLGDQTVVVTPSGTEIIQDGIYRSDRVLELIKKHLNCVDPEKCIGNW